MASGVTDANGNATFTNVAARAHSVSVSASGYQPDSGTINATADGQTFQVVLTALGVAVAPVMTINGSQTSVQVAKGASLQYSITGLTPNGTVHINTAGHGTSFTWTADATGSVSNTTNTGTTPAGVYVVTAQDVTSGQTFERCHRDCDGDRGLHDYNSRSRPERRRSPGFNGNGNIGGEMKKCLM